MSSNFGSALAVLGGLLVWVLAVCSPILVWLAIQSVSRMRKGGDRQERSIEERDSERRAS
jgi:hypothetical protein